METNTSESNSLAILVLIVAVLVAFFFAWLLLSTCLGPEIMRPLRELWSTAVLASRSGNGPRAMRMASARRRTELGYSESDMDVELWEMERMRGRRG